VQLHLSHGTEDATHALTQIARPAQVAQHAHDQGIARPMRAFLGHQVGYRDGCRQRAGAEELDPIGIQQDLDGLAVNGVVAVRHGIDQAFPYSFERQQMTDREQVSLLGLALERLAQERQGLSEGSRHGSHDLLLTHAQITAIAGVLAVHPAQADPVVGMPAQGLACEQEQCGALEHDGAVALLHQVPVAQEIHGGVIQQLLDGIGKRHRLSNPQAVEIQIRQRGFRHRLALVDQLAQAIMAPGFDLLRSHGHRTICLPLQTSPVSRDHGLRGIILHAKQKHPLPIHHDLEDPGSPDLRHEPDAAAPARDSGTCHRPRECP
jgi:hypothetical protein